MTDVADVLATWVRKIYVKLLSEHLQHSYQPRILISSESGAKRDIFSCQLGLDISSPSVEDSFCSVHESLALFANDPSSQR